MTPSHTPLYLSQEIRALEQAASHDGLMRKAGLAIAALATEFVRKPGDTILIVAGPGNNGGDALVAALHLKQNLHRVVVVLAGIVNKLPPDARAACDAWFASGGTLQSAIPENMQFGLAIDGLFGIGLQRPVSGQHAELIQQLNRLTCPILAIDIASGLSADTGCTLGHAVVATHTLTFIGLKPGFFMADGPDHTGNIRFNNLGVRATDSNPQGVLLAREMFIPALPPRMHNSHKGLYGSVAVVGGANGMTGAVLLAARAALLIGSGRVYGGLLAEHGALLDPAQPELMLRRAPGLHKDIPVTCAVVGPGLGRSEDAAKIVADWLLQPIPLVLDADALRLVSLYAQLKTLLQQRTHPTIITPHPGEAAALLACSGDEIQQDRITNALKLAQELRVTVILKGAGTICADTDGTWAINTTGNPGLASAGTGDVLAGIIGGLIAQGVEPSHAARLGVYLHGAAADALVAEGTGPVGLTASEVALKARELINKMVEA